MKPVIEERSVECDSDVCGLWTELADTERMNRAVGMKKVEVTPLANDSAARFLLRTNLGGFTVEMEERPYEWTYLKGFKIRRIMRSGPAASLEFGYAFDTLPTGKTRVTIRLEIEPRYWILSPFISLNAAQTLRRMEEEVRRVDVALAAGERPHRTAKHPASRRELERAAQEVRKMGPPEIAERLIALVRDGDDADVLRIRPYEIADAWGMDRRDVLETCLRAVRAGLLELRWEVICPSCRTATVSLLSLADLNEHGTCQLCDLAFEIELDEAVEATFAPAKGVREVDTGPYCIGGPARTPHVVAQAILPAAGEAVLSAPSELGRYKLFVRGGRAGLVEIVDDGSPAVDVDADTVQSSHARLAKGGTIVVRSRSNAESHVKLERAAWVTHAATAREVTALPAFRRDFSKDTVRPGTALKVSRVAIFFSDLTASTQLYSDVGDAAAFRLVHDHFDVVLAIIEKHKGTLVKTIGDAVMSVFSDEQDGLAASIDILRAFHAFRVREPHYMKTHIKLGLYAGPCYVVTANGVLDYFGQTVNIAARLQGEAKPGELVIEQDLADRALAADALQPDAIVERFDAKLKGVSVAIPAARVR
jgi:class 3 adenylate cyclase